MREYNTYNVCHNGEGMQVGDTNTCVDVLMYLCKVDYMMGNNFIYATVILDYNKVMHIIPTTYRVATILEY